MSTIKDMTNSYNKTPPRYIDYDNRPVTLLRKIDDIANRHYIDKIDKIRQNFKKIQTDTHRPLKNDCEAT